MQQFFRACALFLVCLMYCQQIAVTVGVSEGLFAAMVSTSARMSIALMMFHAYYGQQAFVNPGDEVIIMEPAFDIYPAQAQVRECVPPALRLHVYARPFYSCLQMAGATVRRVPMRPSPEAERNPDKMGLAARML